MDKFPWIKLWIVSTVAGTALSIGVQRLYQRAERIDKRQDAFRRIEDREGRIWYVKPSQVVSIEPQVDIGGYGKWPNGCFARLSTPGFPIHFSSESDVAATILGLR